MKNNDVLDDYIAMIKDSWTYGKMAPEEQATIIELLKSGRTIEAVKGCKKTRWAILNAIYNAYLMGLGYNNNPLWRDSSTEKPSF
jgi:SRSO17 transposase